MSFIRTQLTAAQGLLFVHLAAVAEVMLAGCQLLQMRAELINDRLLCFQTRVDASRLFCV